MTNIKQELLEKYPTLKEQGLTVKDSSTKFVEAFYMTKNKQKLKLKKFIELLQSNNKKLEEFIKKVDN